MGNFNYWKASLENVLEKEIITDKLVEKIIGISEMEYEYTEHESVKPSKKEVNPLDEKIKKLEKEIEVYQKWICRRVKCDSVSVENGVVTSYSKLP